MSALPAQAAGKAAPRKLAVIHAWSRATAPGAPVGAAYLTVVSNGAADELLSVRSVVAARAELHSMTMNNGEMQMRPMPALAVPAGGTLAFAPGGYHIMLMELKAPLREGTHFALQLRFRVAGDIVVDVPVLGMGAMEAPSTATPAHVGSH